MMHHHPQLAAIVAVVELIFIIIAIIELLIALLATKIIVIARRIFDRVMTEGKNPTFYH